MNGAQSLVKNLLAADVEVCFANPGTSEMHFVAALDERSNNQSIRCVLCLAEGVVTGAADGYARMSGKPGVTLLHLGPGLGNGLANLHNARKARSSIVNIVGEHATYHVEFDAPLTADIEGIARPVSHWVNTCDTADSISSAALTACRVASSYPGHIATLILPANVAWSECSPASADVVPIPHSGDHSEFATAGDAEQISTQTERTQRVASLLRGGLPSVLILTGNCLSERGLVAADKIRSATGAQILAQTSNARFERGAGRVAIDAVPYVVDQALECLSPYRNVIPVCAKNPVAFFGYPDKPSVLTPADATIETLAHEDDDGLAALESLVSELDCGDLPVLTQTFEPPAMPETERLDADSIGAIVANELPENAIVVDESISVGRKFAELTSSARAHSWLQICGGSIGDGFPLATGAAIACPDRRVVALQADGSGMYTLQALWTQAREQLNITTIVLANQAYAILKHELKNVGAVAGETAQDLMELQRPELDWVSLAAGMGVSATKVESNSALITALQNALSRQGPYLIEARIE